jgi:hypothetical protein
MASKLSTGLVQKEGCLHTGADGIMAVCSDGLVDAPVAGDGVTAFPAFTKKTNFTCYAYNSLLL